MLLLHPVAQLGFSDFSVHPSTVIGLAALGGAYLWRMRRGPSRLSEAEAGLADPAALSKATPTAAQRANFFGALVIMFFTLNGPLHDISDSYLFSAHMVQHLVLTLIVPPMLILGTPGWMLRPLVRNQALFRMVRATTATFSCFVIFNVMLAFWHLPPLYNLALAYHPVHIVQHLMFLVAAVYMWWPLTSMLPEFPRASYPVQIGYCFLLTVPMSVIAIYISMSDTLLYPAYATAPRIMGISPMADQQYGGLVMWIPGAIFFYLVMTVVFFKWWGSGGDDEASAQVGAPITATPTQ